MTKQLLMGSFFYCGNERIYCEMKGNGRSKLDMKTKV